jgi:hypothetical protein
VPSYSYSYGTTVDGTGTYRYGTGISYMRVRKIESFSKGVTIIKINIFHLSHPLNKHPSKRDPT